MDVYVEIGKKKAFAGALAWPGWSRSGRDPEFALQALLAYGPRFERVLKPAGLQFQPPAALANFRIVEHLEGDATTDFGAPGAIPAFDRTPVDDQQLQRLLILLKACWRALDAVAGSATGKELHKGPRGGGRELDGIIRHVLGANQAYLSKLGWKHKLDEQQRLAQQLNDVHEETFKALGASARGELPERGPRGGEYWPARYFVRREAWHVLDHVWEIEDRAGLS